MKVIGFTEFGGPEVLGEYDVPDPVPGPGQVRVRVRAAAVNPTDTLARAGRRGDAMRKMPTPYVVGMDFAGVLAQVGPDSPTELQVGDHVMGLVIPSGSNGAYAEQVVVPADSVTRMPIGENFAAAATLPMNGLTARLSLDLLGLEPGRTLAVTGAAGTYGGYVIQLAKADGVRVIADASPQDHDLVQSLGADVVVNRGNDVAKRVREVVPNGVDGLADGAVLNEKVADAVCDGGRIVTVRYFVGEERRGITWHPVRVRDHPRERQKLNELRQLVEAGRLTLRVADVLPATQAPAAHRRLEEGGVRGRLVLLFD